MQFIVRFYVKDENKYSLCIPIESVGLLELDEARKLYGPQVETINPRGRQEDFKLYLPEAQARLCKPLFDHCQEVMVTTVEKALNRFAFYRYVGKDFTVVDREVGVDVNKLFLHWFKDGCPHNNPHSPWVPSEESGPPKPERAISVQEEEA